VQRLELFQLAADADGVGGRPGAVGVEQEVALIADDRAYRSHAVQRGVGLRVESLAGRDLELDAGVARREAALGVARLSVAYMHTRP